MADECYWAINPAPFAGAGGEVRAGTGGNSQYIADTDLVVMSWLWIGWSLWH
jgi:hypothetical protein